MNLQENPTSIPDAIPQSVLARVDELNAGKDIVIVLAHEGVTYRVSRFRRNPEISHGKKVMLVESTGQRISSFLQNEMLVLACLNIDNEEYHSFRA